MTEIPVSHRDLLDDQEKVFAFLATIMEDGSPQVTPVWFSWDGQHLLINSALGRVKDQNMRERPQVAVTLMKMDDPYRYLQFRGTVVEITTEGALDHIKDLAIRYQGQAWKGSPGQTRVIYRIQPEHISAG